MNSPRAVKFSASISFTASPAHFRGSLLPWVSQVFDDSVIQIRTKRVLIGGSDSFSACVPPLLFRTSPPGKSVHAPAVGLLDASFPNQNCTAYLLAYGFAHAICSASISCGVPKSITIHCGLRASSSPVNFFVRYGL